MITQTNELDDRPSIPILYGTETGNAQDLAKLLAKRLNRLCFNAQVYGMDEYDIVSLLPSNIFDPTANASSQTFRLSA